MKILKKNGYALVILILVISFSCKSPVKKEGILDFGGTGVDPNFSFTNRIGIPDETRPEASTEAEIQKRTQWWRDAKFGMIIHWGISSQLEGEYKGKVIPGPSEWIQYKGKIPLSEYRELGKSFNPKDFDADAWTELAKYAGMKYMIITAKHHDGFAMYHSKVSKYNIVDQSIYGKDPMDALKKSCDKHGVKFGFYYSQELDWEHPECNNSKSNSIDYDYKNQTFSKYWKEKSLPQIEELVKKYKPVALWFDSGHFLDKTYAYQASKVVRKHSPNTMINSRVSRWAEEYIKDPAVYDYFSPSDNFIPGDDVKDGLWESAVTINSAWGFKKNANDWRSTESIMHGLLNVVSRGGNYLLNIGPDAHGVIPKPTVKILRRVGDWMKINSESIYGTSASPFKSKSFDWGYITQKDKKLYLHVFNWPSNGKLNISGLQTKVDTASLLSNKAILNFEQNDKILSLNVPSTAPDGINSVIVLDMVSSEIETTKIEIQSEADKFHLNALHADYNEENEAYTWQVEVLYPGEYDVIVESKESGSHEKPTWFGDGMKVNVSLNDNKSLCTGTLKRDREEDNPVYFFWKSIFSDLGSLQVKSPGIYTIKLDGIQRVLNKYPKSSVSLLKLHFKLKE